MASLNNYFIFTKSNQIVLGSIEDSLSKNIISKSLKKQIFNLSYLEKYDFICFTSDEISENSNHTSVDSIRNENNNPYNNSICKLNVWDKNFNEISHYLLDKRNETCHSFQILDFFRVSKKDINNNKSKETYKTNPALKKMSIENEEYVDSNSNNYLNPLIFILGTSIYDKIDQTPKSGHIIIIEFTKFFRFNKLYEIEINYPLYNIRYINNYVLTASNTTITAYKLSIRNKKSNEIIDFNNENQITNFKNQNYELNSYLDNFTLDLKEIRKCSEFNFIYDMICHKDYIMISDINKSVSLYKFNREKENIIELCKDSNPIFCISIAKSSHNIYTVCDFNSNLFKMRKDVYPKDDIEKHK